MPDSLERSVIAAAEARLNTTGSSPPLLEQLAWTGPAQIRRELATRPVFYQDGSQSQACLHHSAAPNSQSIGSAEQSI